MFERWHIREIIGPTELNLISKSVQIFPNHKCDKHSAIEVACVYSIMERNHKRNYKLYYEQVGNQLFFILQKITPPRIGS